MKPNSLAITMYRVIKGNTLILTETARRKSGHYADLRRLSIIGNDMYAVGYVNIRAEVIVRISTSQIFSQCFYLIELSMPKLFATYRDSC